MNWTVPLCGIMLCVFLGLFAGTIIVWIWWGKIDLSSLIAEANGEASMSRFQLLIFTFVIAISLFELVEKANPAAFPEISNGILTLLGISASTYAVGKGISYSQPELMKKSGPDKDAVEQVQAAADQATQAASDAKGHAADAQQSARAAETTATTLKQGDQGGGTSS